MQTRQWSVAWLVIVIGLAGCSGLAPFGGNQSGTPTDTHDISYPDGYNESGITDLETAIHQHKSSFNNSDSYSMGINITKRASIINTSFDLNVKKNKTEGRRVLSINGKAEGSSIVEISEYTSENTTYKMNKTQGKPVQYKTYPSLLGGTTFIGENFVTGWVSNATVGEASRVTHDGEQMFQYGITDADSAKPFIIESSEDPTLNEFNGTMLVDENGIVQSFSYRMNYTTADGTQKPIHVDYQTNDLNSTTIKEPSWVQTAREQA